MSKRAYNIYIENDIIELLELKKLQEPDFTPSQFIEQMLRDFLHNDLNKADLEEEKIKARAMKLEKELLLIKLQQRSMQKAKEDLEEEWYRKRGLKKKDSVKINLEEWK